MKKILLAFLISVSIVSAWVILAQKDRIESLRSDFEAFQKSSGTLEDETAKTLSHAGTIISNWKKSASAALAKSGYAISDPSPEDLALIARPKKYRVAFEKDRLHFFQFDKPLPVEKETAYPSDDAIMPPPVAELLECRSIGKITIFTNEIIIDKKRGGNWSAIEERSSHFVDSMLDLFEGKDQPKLERERAPAPEYLAPSSLPQ